MDQAKQFRRRLGGTGAIVLGILLLASFVEFASTSGAKDLNLHAPASGAAR